MTDIHRPTDAEVQALRQRLVAQKREAVYQAARRFYTAVIADMPWDVQREAWRPVRYAVDDLVLTEQR